MKQERTVARATLGRLPEYLKYLRNTDPETKTVSATAISKALGYGEVQVRKDLSAVCGAGKPKIGYVTEELIRAIEQYLSGGEHSRVVIVGAGKLGGALLDYDGFCSFGMEIVAAFDSDEGKCGQSPTGKDILSIAQLETYCREQGVRIGVIAVPKKAAQEVCDRLVCAGVRAIWNFSTAHLKVPADVLLQNENLALSLAHMHFMLSQTQR